MAPTPNKVIAPKIPFSLFDKKSNIFNIATFFFKISTKSLYIVK